MDGATLQRIAADRADELPGAELDHPFGPEWDVHKVRGKVFMLQAVVAGEPIVNLKASPYDALALRGEFAEIGPGYHMNKKHWITLRAGAKLDAELVRELVTDSYLLVIEKNVPKREWPVDPTTFGDPCSLT